MSNSVEELQAQLARKIALLDEALTSAEEANRKANSESAYAYNAKQNAEEHAATVAKIRGAVDADVGAVAAAKKNAEDTSAAISALRAGTAAEVVAVSAAKDLITSAQEQVQGISAKCVHDASTVETLRLKLESGAERATENVRTADEAIKRVNEVLGIANQVDEALKAKRDTISTQTDAIAEFHAQSKEHLDSIKKLVALAKETEEKIEKYEGDLVTMRGEYEQLRNRVESLLPGAASASLALAFRSQQGRFSRPQTGWLIAFAGSLVVLFFVGIIGFPGFGAVGGERADSWDSIFRHFISRIPLAAPLIWLAIYAGRNYTMAVRVQEDYAFKEAVSTAFEGYKREMANIDSSGSGGAAPLVDLCRNVLTTLAERPGRIYEGKHEDVTPLTPLRAAISELSGVARAVGEAMKGGGNAADGKK